MWRWLGIALISVLCFGYSGAVGAQGNCAPSNLPLFDWSLTDFCQHSVPYDEIRSGGPRKDGIPSVTDPRMETVSEARQWLVDQSPVIVVAIEGEARAYPQAILMWHEIANDTVGGVPIAVTFCPLCNSAIVFDRRVDGRVLEFGVSGFLRKSDMVMYDRQTESWWQQFIGEGIVGEYTGVTLDVVPSQVVGFGQFAERYPDGRVMSRETGYRRDYGINPYVGYDGISNPWLFDGTVDPRLSATEHVLAGVVAEVPIAYPFSVLSREAVVNDVVGDVPVVAFWQSGTLSALDDSVINNSRDIGTAALFSRELEGQTLRFTAVEGGFRDEETGSLWNAFGEAVTGPLAGKRLRQLIAAPHFWFAWAAFYPETTLYGITP